MGSLRIQGFGGIRPRVSRTVEGRGLAQIAHNTKLWRGTVNSLREPCVTATATVDIKSMHRKENCWVVSDNPCASFAEGDTNCPYLFSTGVMPWPAYAIVQNCDCNEIVYPEWKRLGLPRPDAPIVDFYELPAPSEIVEFGVKREPWRDARAWVFAYVDSQGREGPLSAVSEVVDGTLNGSAMLTIPADTFDPSYDIVAVRLYRVVSQTEDLYLLSNMGEAVTPTMEAFLVGEFVHTSGGGYQIDDTVMEEDLGPVAVGWKNYEPPENLQGLISLPEGVLVGFEGKNLWFSQPWDFHAWNCHLNLDDCIKKIIYCDNFIYVMTDGHPYVISAESPDKDCRCCRSVSRSQLSFPILCPESAAKIANGVMWASHDGMVIMRGASAAVSTDRYIDRDSWATWRPETVRGIVYKGKYIGFSDFVTPIGEHDRVLPKGFIWDFGETPFADGDTGFDSNLTTHDVPAWTTYETRDGFLFLSYGKEIRRWEGSPDPLRFVWRSTLRVEVGLLNYACAKVVSEDHYRRQPNAKELHFTLYADGRKVFTRLVKDGNPFRLPRTAYAVDYEVEISGFVEVNEIHLATSMHELTLVNNT